MYSKSGSSGVVAKAPTDSFSEQNKDLMIKIAMHQAQINQYESASPHQKAVLVSFFVDHFYPWPETDRNQSIRIILSESSIRSIIDKLNKEVLRKVFNLIPIVLKVGKVGSENYPKDVVDRALELIGQGDNWTFMEMSFVLARTPTLVPKEIFNRVYTDRLLKKLKEENVIFELKRALDLFQKFQKLFEPEILQIFFTECFEKLLENESSVIVRQALTTFLEFGEHATADLQKKFGAKLLTWIASDPNEDTFLILFKHSKGIHLFPNEHIGDQLFPSLVSFFDKMDYIRSSSLTTDLGEFLNSTEVFRENKSFRALLNIYFELPKLVKSSNESVQTASLEKNITFLPKILGLSKIPHIDFKSVLVNILELKPQTKLKLLKAIAVGVSDLLQVFPPTIFEKEIFGMIERELMGPSSNDSIRATISESFPKIISIVSEPKRERLFDRIVENIFIDEKKWRVRQTLAEQIKILSKSLSSDVIAYKLIPFSFKLCQDSCASVRKAASQSIVELWKVSKGDQLLESLMVANITGFGSHVSYLNRLDSVRMMEGFLREDIPMIREFWEIIEQLKDDRVEAVRIEIAKILSTQKKNESLSVEEKEKIERILASMQNDSSRVVKDLIKGNQNHILSAEASENNPPSSLDTETGATTAQKDNKESISISNTEESKEIEVEEEGNKVNETGLNREEQSIDIKNGTVSEQPMHIDKDESIEKKDLSENHNLDTGKGLNEKDRSESIGNLVEELKTDGQNLNEEPIVQSNDDRKEKEISKTSQPFLPDEEETHHKKENRPDLEIKEEVVSERKDLDKNEEAVTPDVRQREDNNTVPEDSIERVEIADKQGDLKGEDVTPMQDEHVKGEETNETKNVQVENDEGADSNPPTDSTQDIVYQNITDINEEEKVDNPIPSETKPDSAKEVEQQSKNRDAIDSEGTFKGLGSTEKEEFIDQEVPITSAAMNPLSQIFQSIQINEENSNNSLPFVEDGSVVAPVSESSEYSVIGTPEGNQESRIRTDEDSNSHNDSSGEKKGDLKLDVHFEEVEIYLDTLKETGIAEWLEHREL